MFALNRNPRFKSEEEIKQNSPSTDFVRGGGRDGMFKLLLLEGDIRDAREKEIF